MTKIHPFVIAVTVADLLFAGLFYVFILPQVSTLGKLQAERDAASTSSSYSAQSISRQKADYEKLKTAKETVAYLLPSGDNQYDLSVQVDALSKQVGVGLASFSVSLDTKPATAQTTSGAVASTAAATSSLKKVTMNIGVTGSYDQVKSFVKGLSTLERFIQIDQVLFSLAAKPTGTLDQASLTSGDQVSGQITAVAFYLPVAIPAQ
ncbi:MAG: hypothetical protein K0S20_692 [Patescibacteria group bacterium]|jgi:Tfp pilus assembly protein PilO|nr:hypothetical protein [Patescibacteria group bacterium]